MKSSGTEAGRVLVVQDEPVISWICSQTLRGEGFKVDIAANGSIAEGMLGEKEYDLVLIDIRAVQPAQHTHSLSARLGAD